MNNKKMQIEYVPISEIIPYEKNPRKNDRAVEIVSKSISNFGFKNPIILDKNNEIVAGHTRLKAAEKLRKKYGDEFREKRTAINEKGEEYEYDFVVNLKELPTIRAEDLTPEQVKAFRIMDNKSHEFSFWDEEKLVEEFNEIGDDIVNTGFTESEIEYILDKFELDKEKIISTSYEDIDVDENKYEIKKGDIIVFDEKHKLLCGNSKDEKELNRLLNKQKIDLVVTSPPYNLDIKYGEYKDNKEMKEYMDDMGQIFGNLKENMNKGRFACINVGREWGPVNLPAKYDLLMEENKYSFFRNIYWKKPFGSARATTTSRNPFPRYYIPRVQTEVISIYQYDMEKPEILDLMITYKYNEGPRDKEEKIAKELLNKYSGNVWTMMTETTLGKSHAAPFPIQLPYNCIKFFPKEGENIIDPFMGSGTTLLAGEQTNRKVYGVELSPGYCSVIIERYKRLKKDAQIEVMSGNGKKREI